MASAEPDANWDKCAADGYAKFCYPDLTVRPVFLADAADRDWIPFWESIRPGKVNLIVFGSPRRFGLVRDILEQLKQDNHRPPDLDFEESNLPGAKRGLRITPAGHDAHKDFISIEPVSNMANSGKSAWEDCAAVVVVRDTSISDPQAKKVDLHRLVLIMGATGPATLAASVLHSRHPAKFEPRAKSGDGYHALTTILKLKVEYDSTPGEPFDNRIILRGAEVERQFLDSAPESRYHGRLLRFSSRARRYFVSLYLWYRELVSSKQRSQDASTKPAAAESCRDGTARNNQVIRARRLKDMVALHRPYQSAEYLRLPMTPSKEYRPGAHWSVTWGWKRDSNEKSRIVFFTARLVFDGSALRCLNPYIYLRSKSSEDEAGEIERVLKGLTKEIKLPRLLKREKDTVLLELGRPTKRDEELVEKLVARGPDVSRPRKHTPADDVKNMIVQMGCKVLDLKNQDDQSKITTFFPCDVYAGAGLSYEAGVPALAELHEAFGVDNRERGDFLFGSNDPLPKNLADKFMKTIESFLMVDIAYITQPPSASHCLIAELQKKGKVRHVLTDNVDDFFGRVGVVDVRTRGPGVVNEKFDFENKELGLKKLVPEWDKPNIPLLVVGISADRRQIIEQARKNKRHVVIVNPVHEVSPYSKNMDYVEPRDTVIFAKFSETHEVLKSLLPKDEPDVA